MNAVCPFSTTLARMAAEPPARDEGDLFPLMPVGQAVDMGRAPDGRPLIDPRIFESREFARNP